MTRFRPVVLAAALGLAAIGLSAARSDAPPAAGLGPPVAPSGAPESQSPDTVWVTLNGIGFDMPAGWEMSRPR